MISDRPTGALAGVGDVLDGRYRLVRKLGTGGSATVFLADDERLGRQVAVKVLHPRVGDTATPRIEREARQAAALSHPHVVQVHDVVVHDDDAYIVMEYVAGTPLDALLRDEGPFDEARTIELGIMLAGALEAAHREGVVHRDVKPSNVLVRPDGTAKLADFGTARMGHGDTLTEEGTLVGSAAYVAPEQVQGGGHTDHRVDLYSLGIVLYELATGVRPFEGDSVAATVIQRLHRDPLPPSSYGVSPALEAVILKAMARQPADRFDSASALAAALAGLASDAADETQPLRIVADAPPRRPRLGRVVGGTVLGLALVVAAAMAAGWGSAVGTPEDAIVTGATAVVPELRGLTLEAADEKAAEAGFRISEVRELPARPTAGTVVDQLPAAGTALPTVQGLHVIVSSGPARASTSAGDVEPTGGDERRTPAGDGAGARVEAGQPEPEPEPDPEPQPQPGTAPAAPDGPGEGNGRGRPEEPGSRGRGQGRSG